MAFPTLQPPGLTASPRSSSPATTTPRYGGSYRLATTLLDHRACPAGALIALYHQRWEHAVTYLALRHTLLDGRVLRSREPDGLR